MEMLIAYICLIIGIMYLFKLLFKELKIKPDELICKKLEDWIEKNKKEPTIEQKLTDLANDPKLELYDTETFSKIEGKEIRNIGVKRNKAQADCIKMK